mgnify:CR=1 FL=1
MMVGEEVGVAVCGVVFGEFVSEGFDTFVRRTVVVAFLLQGAVCVVQCVAVRELITFSDDEAGAEDNVVLKDKAFCDIAMYFGEDGGNIVNYIDIQPIDLFDAVAVAAAAAAAVAVADAVAVAVAAAVAVADAVAVAAAAAVAVAVAVADAVAAAVAVAAAPIKKGLDRCGRQTCHTS